MADRESPKLRPPTQKVAAMGYSPCPIAVCNRAVMLSLPQPFRLRNGLKVMASKCLARLRKRA